MKNKGLIAALVILGALVLVVPMLGGGMMGAGYGPGMMRGYGGGYAGSGWMWGAGMGLRSLVMLIFWAAIIVGGVLLYRSTIGHPGHQQQGAAREILDRRFAAGEI